MRGLRRVRAIIATPTIITTIPTLIHTEFDPCTPPIIGGTERSPQAEPINEIRAKDIPGGPACASEASGARATSHPRDVGVCARSRGQSIPRLSVEYE